MGKVWEIRGLFGNEFAMEATVEELRKLKGLDWVVLDRRNLSVRLAKRDKATEEVVKRAFEIHHGFAEHEGPLGEYDRQKEEERKKKMRKEEKDKGKASH